MIEFLSIPIKVIKHIYRWIKTWYLNKKVTGVCRKIIINDPFFKVKIIVDPGGKLVLNGNLILERHLEGDSPALLKISTGAR